MNNNPESTREWVDPVGASAILWRAIGLVAVMGLAVALGKQMLHGSEFVSFLWPPAGVLCALLTLFHPRHWWWVLLLTACVERGVGLFFEPFDWSAGGLAFKLVSVVTTSVQGVCFACIMRLWLRSSSPLSSTRVLVWYILAAVVLNTAVTSLAGLSIRSAFDPGMDLYAEWIPWWTGDLMGVLAISTPILAFRDRAIPFVARRRAESAILLGSLTIVGIIMFGSRGVAGLLAPIAVMPLLAWSFIRFPPRLLTLCMLILAIVVSITLAHDRGPFFVEGRAASANVLNAQGYLFPAMIFMLIVASSSRENMIRAEQELETERHVRRLEKLEALGTMASGVVHDFGNIASAIRAYQTSLRNMLPDAPPKVRRAIDGIGLATTEAQDITTQLMEFARDPDQDQSGRNTTPTDLSAEVLDATSALREQVPDGITLDTRAVEADIMVDALPGNSQRLVTNLVLNAVDAIRDTGKSTGVVTIELRREGRTIELAVADTGAGMTAETRERMFDPFFTTKPRGNGTGLGLAVVMSIVKELNGSIHVDSSPGTGTRMCIRIPAGSKTKTDFPRA